ncbi:ectoine synthase [Nonomuraea insulae]|uniref:L-ectoine synthase n=1 Tax=Nonomuraea insulae TaxID=1616787 RepID=A0ABW1D726_9ACTN
MIIRRVGEVDGVKWGNGISRRMLVADDGMGYTLTDTTVWAGTRSPLQYRNHLEACYCVSGTGIVIDAAGNEHRIVPGTMYALDKHDGHYLVASPSEDLRLICVFSPALNGYERHDFGTIAFSQY